jgi:hypothetical protein
MQRIWPITDDIDIQRRAACFVIACGEILRGRAEADGPALGAVFRLDAVYDVNSIPNDYFG